MSKRKPSAAKADTADEPAAKKKRVQEPAPAAASASAIDLTGDTDAEKEEEEEDEKTEIERAIGDGQTSQDAEAVFADWFRPLSRGWSLLARPTDMPLIRTKHPWDLEVAKRVVHKTTGIAKELCKLVVDYTDIRPFHTVSVRHGQFTDTLPFYPGDTMQRVIRELVHVRRAYNGYYATFHVDDANEPGVPLSPYMRLTAQHNDMKLALDFRDGKTPTHSAMVLFTPDAVEVRAIRECGGYTFSRVYFTGPMIDPRAHHGPHNCKPSMFRPCRATIHGVCAVCNGHGCQGGDARLSGMHNCENEACATLMCHACKSRFKDEKCPACTSD